MPAPETTRRGKIARCPLHIREEVNRRLLDGQSGPTILKWLNSQEAVLKVLDEHFNEEPVSAQNLTEWRQGGYLDFKRRLEQIERTKQLSGYAVKLAEHGQAYAGNVAIVGGQLLEIFESLDVEEQKTLLKEKPATYIALVDVLARWHALVQILHFHGDGQRVFRRVETPAIRPRVTGKVRLIGPDQVRVDRALVLNDSIPVNVHHLRT